MPSNHLILCRPLLLLPSIFPSIRVFSNESALRIRWPKYPSFSFNSSPSIVSMVPAEPISMEIIAGCCGSEALHVITSKFPSWLTSQPHSHCSPWLFRSHALSLSLSLSVSLRPSYLFCSEGSSSSPRTSLLLHCTRASRPTWVASAPVFSLASHAFPLTLSAPATLTFLQTFQCPALGFHTLVLSAGNTLPPHLLSDLPPSLSSNSPVSGIG